MVVRVELSMVLNPFPPTLKRVLGILSVSETHNTLKLTIYYGADFAYLLSS